MSNRNQSLSIEIKGITAPSPWVVRFLPEPSPQIAEGRGALDLACGRGRHSRLLLERGWQVTALDRNLDGIADLIGDPRLEVIEADLEDGSPFPLAGRRFSVIVVTNYLYRPLLPALVAAVAPGGLLIYETFARGNEAFGKPSNPDFLLWPGELLAAVRDELRVLAYEDLIVKRPKPAAVQRIAARRETRA